MKISKRSKVEAGIIALIVCLACVASVMSTRTITDSSDSIYTNIVTSAGGVYAATAAGLQQAIYSIDNLTGGTVTIPIIINISTPILLTNNTKLQGTGFKSGLRLANSANTSLLQNYYWVHEATYASAPNYNITITNMLLDGNTYHQKRGCIVADYQHQAHAIRLERVSGVYINNCKFKDIMFDGVDAVGCSDIHVDHNYFYGVGMNFTGYTTEVTTRACYFFWCNNMSFNDNYCKDMHTSAVSVEPGQIEAADLVTYSVKPCRDFEICNNIVTNCWDGVWCEGQDYGSKSVRRGIINDNVITNATNTDGYVLNNLYQMNGIACTRYTGDITISGNNINKVGDTTYYKANGLWIGGSNITVTGNTVDTCYGNGTYIMGHHITFTGNRLNDCLGKPGYGYGVYILYSATAGYANPGNYNIISNNDINHCTEYGIYNQRDNNTIIGNIITGNDSADASTYGIRMGGSSGTTQNASNCIVIGNTIIKFHIGIYESKAGFNMYVGNNCLWDVVHAYDINSPSYKPTGQTNFTNFNFGAWT